MGGGEDENEDLTSVKSTVVKIIDTAVLVVFNDLEHMYYKLNTIAIVLTYP